MTEQGQAREGMGECLVATEGGTAGIDAEDTGM